MTCKKTINTQEGKETAKAAPVAKSTSSKPTVATLKKDLDSQITEVAQTKEKFEKEVNELRNESSELQGALIDLQDEVDDIATEVQEIADAAHKKHIELKITKWGLIAVCVVLIVKGVLGV